MNTAKDGQYLVTADGHHGNSWHHEQTSSAPGTALAQTHSLRRHTQCDEPGQRGEPRLPGLLSYQLNCQRFITDTGQLFVGVVFYAMTGCALILSIG